jgi:hypothetical protein
MAHVDPHRLAGFEKIMKAHDAQQNWLAMLEKEGDQLNELIYWLDHHVEVVQEHIMEADLSETEQVAFHLLLSVYGNLKSLSSRFKHRDAHLHRRDENGFVEATVDVFWQFHNDSSLFEKYNNVSGQLQEDDIAEIIARHGTEPLNDAEMKTLVLTMDIISAISKYTFTDNFIVNERMENANPEVPTIQEMIDNIPYHVEDPYSPTPPYETPPPQVGAPQPPPPPPPAVAVGAGPRPPPPPPPPPGASTGPRPPPPPPAGNAPSPPPPPPPGGRGPAPSSGGGQSMSFVDQIKNRNDLKKVERKENPEEPKVQPAQSEGSLLQELRNGRGNLRKTVRNTTPVTTNAALTPWQQVMASAAHGAQQRRGVIEDTDTDSDNDSALPDPTSSPTARALIRIAKSGSPILSEEPPEREWEGALPRGFVRDF